MKNFLSVLIISVLLITGILLSGCAGGEGRGKLQFYANGEDFVRQGFVSKDGWSIIHFTNLLSVRSFRAVVLCLSAS